jgi:hypothetical protein
MNMPIRTLVAINIADMYQDDLKRYIQANNHPGEVFPESELSEWAMENGYIKNPEA